MSKNRKKSYTQKKRNAQKSNHEMIEELMEKANRIYGITDVPIGESFKELLINMTREILMDTYQNKNTDDFLRFLALYAAIFAYVNTDIEDKEELVVSIFSNLDRITSLALRQISSCLIIRYILGYKD